MSSALIPIHQIKIHHVWQQQQHNEYIDVLIHPVLRFREESTRGGSHGKSPQGQWVSRRTTDYITDWFGSDLCGLRHLVERGPAVAHEQLAVVLTLQRPQRLSPTD
ncbi:MAG: hypothetical protein ACPHGV_09295 [Synechococcus sp.]